MREFQDIRAFFSRPSNLRGILDLGAYWLAIFAVCASAHLLSHPGAYLAAAIIMGGLQHGLLNLAHEAWHSLCFVSKGTNHFVGAWLYAYPLGVPYHHDRRRHLDHHRLVGTREDPDWVNYTNENRTPIFRLAGYLFRRLLGSQLFETLSSTVLKGKPRIAPVSLSGETPAPGRELLAVLAVQGTLLAGFCSAGYWWEYLCLWVFPLSTFTSLFVSLRSFVEHTHAQEDVNPEQRLYDFTPGLIERFFISPCHFNFHAVHHAHPSIPHFRLSRFKHLLKENDWSYPGKDHRGYLHVLWRYVRAQKSA